MNDREKVERRRREFLRAGMAAGAAAVIPGWAVAMCGSEVAQQGEPRVEFPTGVRERMAVASYPFREFVAGREGGAKAAGKMPLKEFGARVKEKFGLTRVELWSEHFLSLEPAYLAEIRESFAKAGVRIADIAVDGEHSPYASDPAERERAIAFSKQWIDAAVTLGSPSARTNIPVARGEKEDLERLAGSLRQVAEYGAKRGVVVHLENDNPVSEDPFFLVKVVERVNSPWLHTLPDFCNTLAAHDDEYSYRGIREMFKHAYGICHVKAMELNEKKELRRVDLEKTFGILKESGYRGYLSMEFDSPGDPFAGTKELIAATEKYLG
jgi:sugar phosphate isomerase/epimerase